MRLRIGTIIVTVSYNTELHTVTVEDLLIFYDINGKSFSL